MAEVINLRQARKAKRRSEAERQAQANRAKHGRTTAEKRRAEAERLRHEATVARARRDRDDGMPEG